MKKKLVYGLFVLLCGAVFLSCKEQPAEATSNTFSSDNWQLVRTSADDGYCWNIFFLDKENGWVTCDSGRIIHTTNGGLDWSIQETSAESFIKSISFINKDIGWACGKNIIYNTVNGGKDWLIQFEDESLTSYERLKGFIKIFFKNENYGWAINNAGELLLTSDGGNTWTIQEKWESYGPTNISFTSENCGFVLTSDSHLLCTTNGGFNWEKIKIEGTKFLSGIKFVNKNYGWLITMYGLSSTYEPGSPVLSTTDGGKSWIQKSIIKDDLLDVDFANETEGWIAGMNNLYSTKDGGANWSKCNVDGFFVDLHVLDNKNVWALDFVGNVYKLVSR